MIQINSICIAFRLSAIMGIFCFLVSPIYAAKKEISSSPLETVTIEKGAHGKTSGWSKNFSCGPGSNEIERIKLAPKDRVVIRLKFRNARGSMPAVLSAEDGGVINGKKGAVAVSSLGTSKVEFAVGGQRGRYTLRVEQGDELQVLEFWVGDETPRGKAGPALTFKGE